MVTSYNVFSVLNNARSQRDLAEDRKGKKYFFNLKETMNEMGKISDCKFLHFYFKHSEKKVVSIFRLKRSNPQKTL